MKETLKLSLALGVLSAVAAALLGFADARTKAPRHAAAVRQKLNALRQVLPTFDNQPLNDTVTCETSGGRVTFYRAMADGRLAAVAGEGATRRGFGGELKVLVGLEPGGRIRTVVVTAHKETPGLGTVATDRKRRKTIGDLFRGGHQAADAETLPPNAYLDQFSIVCSRVEEAPFKVSKDGGKLDAVSGATISSRAVADAVSIVARAFTDNRDRILAGADSEASP